MADQRALAKERFLLLIEQLTKELGSERQAALAAKTDPTYPNKLRESPLRFVGAAQLAKTREALHLRSEFFERADVRAPHYRAYVEGSARVERDDESETAIADLLASTDPDDPLYPTPSEVEWLRGLSFRHIQLGGLRVTPSYLRSTLREKRLQDSGRISRGQEMQGPASDNTIDLPDVRRK